MGSFSYWHRGSGCLSGETLEPGWQPSKQVTFPFDLRDKTVFSVQRGKKKNGCDFLIKRELQKKYELEFAFDSIRSCSFLNNEKIKELQRCATSVLSAGRGSRDETKTVSLSFIGLPGVLLVCFGELAVLVRTVAP